MNIQSGKTVAEFSGNELLNDLWTVLIPKINIAIDDEIRGIKGWNYTHTKEKLQALAKYVGKWEDHRLWKNDSERYYTYHELSQMWCEHCSENFFRRHPSVNDVYLLVKNHEILDKIWVCDSKL